MEQITIMKPSDDDSISEVYHACYFVMPENIQINDLSIAMKSWHKAARSQIQGSFLAAESPAIQRNCTLTSPADDSMSKAWLVGKRLRLNIEE